MDVVLYTGNNGTNAITGLNFSPDFVWLKTRSAAAYYHVLQDVVRGTDRQLDCTQMLRTQKVPTRYFTTLSVLILAGFTVGANTPGYNNIINKSGKHSSPGAGTKAPRRALTS